MVSPAVADNCHIVSTKALVPFALYCRFHVFRLLAKGGIACMQKKSVTFRTPILGEGEVVWGQRWYQRAVLVSYRLSIVTIALSLRSRSQFVVECLRRPKQQGVTLGQNLGRKGLNKVSQILM